MIHVILDPTKLTKYHELKTKVELSLTKAKLNLINNKPKKGLKQLTIATQHFLVLKLFVMICQMTCIATSEGALELINKGIVKDIEVEIRK